jgi:hypothetical protein
MPIDSGLVFFFRWLRSSLRTWAATALTWAEGEHAWAEPEHYNVKPILASCVPRLQFPYRTLPKNSFLLPRKGSAGADFGSHLSKSMWLVIRSYDLPNNTNSAL